MKPHWQKLSSVEISLLVDNEEENDYEDTIYSTFENEEPIFPINDFIDDTSDELTNDVNKAFDDINNEIVDTVENTNDFVSTEINDIKDNVEENLDEITNNFDDSVKGKNTREIFFFVYLH